MDPKIWEASKRGFPFNISMNAIIFISLIAPLIVGFITIKSSDPHLFGLYLPTIVMSMIGYKITGSLIL